MTRSTGILSASLVILLLADTFFENMSATIMFGLGFATVLTLIVVPMHYAMFHGFAYRPLADLN